MDSAPNSCSLTIGLKFLNFDSRLKVNSLSEILPTDLEHNITKYDLSYVVESLDSSINDSITTYWDTHGTLKEHTNVDYDSTLFGSTTDVFVNRTGRQVDAREFESFLQTIMPIPTTDYTLYIFNFTQLDAAGYSHWYSLTPINPDSNTITTNFFSETTNLNTRPVPGYGGNIGRFYFLDLSAYHWFPKFIETAWTGYGFVADAHLNQTIQDIVLQNDPNTSEGREVIRYWIGDWILDIVGNNFIGLVIPPIVLNNEKPRIHPTVDLPVLFLTNLSDYGYSIQKLEWLSSMDRIYTPLDEVAPFYNWNINIKWKFLSSYQGLYDEFHLEYKNGGRVIEVMDGFRDYVESQFDVLFPSFTGDLFYPTIIFLSNDTQMTYYGGAFTGLAGMGWQLINLVPSKIFRFNDTSGFYDIKDKGITRTIVHEIGHTLGFPHPHDNYGWGGDYVESVMSYYISAVNFSTYAIDRFMRSSTDNFFGLYDNIYTEVIQLYGQVANPPEIVDRKIAYALANYSAAILTYNDLDYLSAYNNITNAWTELNNVGQMLEEIIPEFQIPLMFVFIIILCSLVPLIHDPKS